MCVCASASVREPACVCVCVYVCVCVGVYLRAAASARGELTARALAYRQAIPFALRPTPYTLHPVLVATRACSTHVHTYIVAKNVIKIRMILKWVFCLKLIK